MNADASAIVGALIELSKNAPGGQKLLKEIRDKLNEHIHDEALPVTLVTPSGDEPQLAASVTALLEKKYNRKVQLMQRKDDHLLGGAVLQIGDEQIDLSVRGALNGFESQLRSSSVLHS